MTTLTYPDNFVIPSDGDPYDPVAQVGALGTSMQEWASNRQLPDYYWVNASQRNAQIGMTAGAEGYQADNQITYKFSGSQWKAWHTLQPVATTPAWTNLSIGNAVQSATYTLAAGRVFVSGFITLGSTTTVGSFPYMTAPLPLNGYISSAPNGGSDRTLGSANFVDVGVQGYPGACNTWAVSGSLFVRPQLFGAALTYTTQAAISATTPFTWAVGDYLTYDYAYMAD